MKNFTETQERIANKCDELKALLLEKNRKYGNSALEPKRCFLSRPYKNKSSSVWTTNSHESRIVRTMRMKTCSWIWRGI